jgi:3-oxoacyl-[acyl-carrier protein] reductase
MMGLNLENRVAIVTGGSRGIGAAIARELARRGCDIAVVDVAPPEAAADVRKEIEHAGRRVLVIQSDVSDFGAAPQVVSQVVEEFGRLDILVCNAGIFRDSAIWKMTEEQWDEVLNTNLKGCFNYCRASAPVFREQDSGKIVNITSINGMRGKFGLSNYAASKGGIIALTKTVAKELGRSGVNVNAVAPGMVATGMGQEVPPEVLDQAASETVLGRIASPEDIAAVVAFLCSEDARHITGEIIKVDGGQYI